MPAPTPPQGVRRIMVLEVVRRQICLSDPNCEYPRRQGVVLGTTNSCGSRRRSSHRPHAKSHDWSHLDFAQLHLSRRTIPAGVRLILLAKPGITEPFTLMAAIAERLIGRMTATAQVGLVAGLKGAAVGGLDGGGAGDL